MPEWLGDGQQFRSFLTLQPPFCGERIRQFCAAGQRIEGAPQ